MFVFKFKEFLSDNTVLIKGLEMRVLVLTLLAFSYLGGSIASASGECYSEHHQTIADSDHHEEDHYQLSTLEESHKHILVSQGFHTISIDKFDFQPSLSFLFGAELLRSKEPILDEKLVLELQKIPKPTNQNISTLSTIKFLI